MAAKSRASPQERGRLYPIKVFVEELRSIPEAEFSETSRILKFLKERPVDPTTLKRYLVWDRGHYTRNLIDRTPLYELVAICWDIGQISSIHNHQGQQCWMAVPSGRLRVQNYHVIDENPDTGRCAIEKTSVLQMNARKPHAVDSAAPVHRVLNPREYGERAVSLHIYSRPIDSCIVYSEENQTCGSIKLAYTSVDGRRSTRRPALS